MRAILFARLRASVRSERVLSARHQDDLHRLHLGFFPANNFGIAISRSRAEILAGVVRFGAVRNRVRVPDLAAVYLHLSSWRRPSHSFQLAVPGDVRRGPGAHLGSAQVLHLFFRVRRGRGNYRHHSKAATGSTWPGYGIGAHDWRFRGNLRRVARGGYRDATPAGVGVSAAGPCVDANFRDRDGRPRIFQYDWFNRRWREPRLSFGRDAGGLHLSATRLLPLQLQKLFYGLGTPAVAQEIRSVRSRSQRETAVKS